MSMPTRDAASPDPVMEDPAAARKNDEVDVRFQAVAAACRTLLGKTPTKAEWPGGLSRSSVRLWFEDGSVIITRRRHEGRARLEAAVLTALGGEGVPVPRVLAFDGTWLIQEDLGGTRLTQALATTEPINGERLLDGALRGLDAARLAGRETGIEARLPVIGARTDWILRRVEMPGRVGEMVGAVAPDLDRDRTLDCLRPRDRRLVKWDARPGNAIVRGDGTVAWIDWEHCGRREPLDDLVWLLCDEYVPDWPDVEDRLLRDHTASLGGQRDDRAAQTYLAVMGCLHLCQRLSLILRRKKEGPWWSPEECLANDRAGVFPGAVLRLCRRGRRWAVRSDLTPALAPWFASVEKRLR
jgi:hypothetical protein